MKTNIYTQHGEHVEWLNKLSFYKDDIGIMQKRLEEISAKNTGLDIRKEVEHFQNQFIIQHNVIDEIKHHIGLEEDEIQSAIKKNPVATDHKKTEDHTAEREMVENFESNFNKLRHEFILFLSKRM